MPIDSLQNLITNDRLFTGGCVLLEKVRDCQYYRFYGFDKGKRYRTWISPQQAASIQAILDRRRPKYKELREALRELKRLRLRLKRRIEQHLSGFGLHLKGDEVRGIRSLKGE